MPRRPPSPLVPSAAPATDWATNPVRPASSTSSAMLPWSCPATSARVRTSASAKGRSQTKMRYASAAPRTFPPIDASRRSVRQPISATGFERPPRRRAMRECDRLARGSGRRGGRRPGDSTARRAGRPASSSRVSARRRPCGLQVSLGLVGVIGSRRRTASRAVWAGLAAAESCRATCARSRPSPAGTNRTAPSRRRRRARGSCPAREPHPGSPRP